jgi:hypothetical protein
MTPSAAISTAPSPAEVDELAEKYNSLKDDLLQATLAMAEAQKPFEQIQNDLRELVAKYGSAHAEKSKILHGVKDEIMATFGVTTSVDAASIEVFRLALVKAKQARLLGKIFTKTIRWTLNPMAALIIRESGKLSKSLLALYSQCEVVKPKTPTLTVREKSA